MLEETPGLPGQLVAFLRVEGVSKVPNPLGFLGGGFLEPDVPGLKIYLSTIGATNLVLSGAEFSLEEESLFFFNPCASGKFWNFGVVLIGLPCLSYP